MEVGHRIAKANGASTRSEIWQEVAMSGQCRKGLTCDFYYSFSTHFLPGVEDLFAVVTFLNDSGLKMRHEKFGWKT